MGRVRTIIEARGVTVDHVSGWYRATRLTGGGPGMHLETRMSDTLDVTLTTAAGWILEGDGIEALEDWLTVVVTLSGFGQWWDYIWDEGELPSFYEVEYTCDTCDVEMDAGDDRQCDACAAGY